jgi:isopentenyl diphosphate isomerase/L-lactate dehydrogenase-like FMN-dependent dehydrogenase
MQVPDHSRPSLTWETLAVLRERTNLPIVLKGVLHPGDAARAVAEGIDGVGVREVIENLAADFDLTMGLAGRRSVAEIGPDALVPALGLASDGLLTARGNS